MNVPLLGVRRLWAALAGAAFDGARNYWETFGYPSAITYEMALAKYRRQNIAGRIVEMPPNSLWDNPPAITSNNAEWTAAWDNIVTDFNLWSILNRVDCLCALDLYSVLVIGTEGIPLERAPTDRGRPRSVLRRPIFIQPYAGTHAPIVRWNEDSTDPEYKQPLVYELSEDTETRMAPGVRTVRPAAVQVHSSHVVHIAEGALENAIYGAPRLHRVMNDLYDLQKIVGGSAETFWLVANRGLQVDIDKEMALSPDDTNALSDEVEEYVNGLTRVLHTRGVKVNNLGSETPSPKDNFTAVTSLIAAATGIPQRILFGAEAGQLASEQDRANWSERVMERRAHFGEPIIIFPLIKKLTALGCLPTPDNLQIYVQWPESFKMSPLERAQKSAQHARSAANLAKALTTTIPGTGREPTMGSPARPASVGPNGETIPGTPEIPADPGEPPELLMDKLLTLDEARAFMELEQPPPTFDETSDIISNPDDAGG